MSEVAAAFSPAVFRPRGHEAKNLSYGSATRNVSFSVLPPTSLSAGMLHFMKETFPVRNLSAEILRHRLPHIG